MLPCAASQSCCTIKVLGLPANHPMRMLLTIAVLLTFGAAAFADATPKRRHINLPNRPANMPFSDGVIVGDTLYLSGRIGLDRNGKVPENLDTEINNLLDGFSSVLKAGGLSMDDLVTVQVFCPDVSLFDRFNAHYRKHFKKDLPARAFIGSGPLLFGAHFEMQGVAVKSNPVIEPEKPKIATAGRAKK
jgi:2-iminobutanoate/2-iminopropanoate deaminase